MDPAHPETTVLGLDNVPLDLPVAGVASRALAAFLDYLVVGIAVLIWGAICVAGFAVRRQVGWWMAAVFLVGFFLIEYGYFASGPRSLGVKRRAAYLRKGFQIALHSPSVREMTQYTLVAPPGGWDTSLVSSTGTPSSVFNTLSSWTLGAVRAGGVARAPR